MRVALVTNIPAPYRAPVFRSLAETPGWTLRVFVSAEREFDRSWRVDVDGLDVERVRGLSLRGRDRTRGPVAVRRTVTRHIPLGLPAALGRFRPEVVVSGELGARTLLALAYCKLAGVPLVIWTYHSKVSASAAGQARRALWQRLLARADAVVGMGRQARAVLQGLGVPANRIFDAPNAHDADGLRRALERAQPAVRAQALADELDVRKNIALVAGRLVAAKGVMALLDAWQRVPEPARADWTLLFVGDGPLVWNVRAAAAARPSGEIAWLPSVQPDEMPELYVTSRLLVFPTLSEPWGLVANEAMACARPVLCSLHAGCADDLIRPGDSGWLADPADPEAFARALESALTSPDLDRMGQSARDTAAHFGPGTMAAGIRRAVESVRA